MDLFFMERPQYAIRGLADPSEDEIREKKTGDLIEPMIFINDPDRVTTVINNRVDNDE